VPQQTLPSSIRKLPRPKLIHFADNMTDPTMIEYDFEAEMTRGIVAERLSSLSIPCHDQTLKPEVQRMLEKHYAKLRETKGENPVGILNDDFNPNLFTRAMMRAILSQHDCHSE